MLQEVEVEWWRSPLGIRGVARVHASVCHARVCTAVEHTFERIMRAIVVTPCFNGEQSSLGPYVISH